MISAYSIGSAPSLLSIVSVTSARPSAGRDVVPAKTTSSILPPRSDFTPCSPITQESASTTFDLPDPFGPTTQVIPGSKRSVLEEAKDLNPRRVSVFRCTRGISSLVAPVTSAAFSHPTARGRHFPVFTPKAAAAGRRGPRSPPRTGPDRDQTKPAGPQTDE